MQDVASTDNLIRNIIARYEYEENEFLRELEGMQGQVSERSSLCEEVPVLGALCSLVGEIGELRRENKALRYRLSTVVEPKRGVVHRVGAILEGRSNIIPKLMGRRAFNQCEIRSGARERLSTPPHKESLTTSSYSTDISSDVSDPRRATLSPSRKTVAPPLVLPEMSDSDAEHSIFTEVALPNYESGGKAVRGGRTMVRRSKVLSISERSPSSASSRDHSENMTSSRSSFFEIIGLKKKKEKSIESKKETVTGKVVLKKRKRKISESDSVQSSENNARSDKRSLSSVASKGSTATAGNAYGESSDDNKHSWLQAPKQYHTLRQQEEQGVKKCPRSRNSTTVSEESDDDRRGRSSSAQKSAPYLEPDGSRPTSRQHQYLSRESSVSGWIPVDSRAIHDENETIRNELVMIKNRNIRLIEQLREKSMEHSKLASQMSTLQKQIGILRNRCRLNEALEKLSINDRMIAGAAAAIDSVEEKLKYFESELQGVKAEMVKNGQAAISQSFREQNAYQACLEHIERLQRDNFSMLQSRGSDIDNHDQRIRQLLEMMPSYDALYSFTISIVRKLGQLRASYIEKNVHANRSDFEVMHAQSSLLITHAQLERLKLQLYAATERRPHRPASYHGEDLLEKLVKPQMNFLLPFKLHGSRIRKHRRSGSCVMESEVEKNEQSIENEFLRLFDYARCLSRISESAGENKVRLEHVDIKESIPHVREDLQSTSVMQQQGTQACHRGQLLKNCANKTQISQRNRKTQSAGRPISLVETQDRKLATGNIRHFADCVVKEANKEGQSTPTLNLHPLTSCGHVRAIVSSLQDVRNTLVRSPCSTPIMARRMNFSERQRTIDHGSSDSFAGNDLVKYDIPPSQSSGSSDYAVVGTRPLYSAVEKRSMTPKRSPLLGASRLRHPMSCNQANAVLQFNREPHVILRKNVNHANSPPSLGGYDGRNVHQMRRNPEVIGVIREESAASQKVYEKSRLPKISSIPTEKKKCSSWLSRIKATKK